MVIRWLLLVILLNVTVFGQFDWFEANRNSFNRYTPYTGMAFDVNSFGATIFGYHLKTKSVKTDTLASRNSPQKWMVWRSMEDSLVYIEYNTKVLGTGWYTNDDDYDTLYVGTSGALGTPSRFPFNSVVSISYSVKVISYTEGRVFVGDQDANIVDTLNANGTYTGIINNTLAIAFYGAPNTHLGITDVKLSILADSVSSNIVRLENLQPQTWYEYYYSIIVKTSAGDKSSDYYKGVTKYFYTEEIPEGLKVLSEDNFYLTTEDNSYLIYDEE